MTEESPPLRLGLFKNVVFSQIPAHHLQGWLIISVLGPYSVLMWHCECKESQAYALD